MLVKADYVGIVSGETVDKSEVFPIFRGQLPDAPLIENAPVAMISFAPGIRTTSFRGIAFPAALLVSAAESPSLFFQSGKLAVSIIVNPI